MDDSQPTKSRLHNAAQRRARPAMTWHIDGVLPPTGLGQIFGATYTGKSFVALDLALRVANGLPDWYGHTINVKGPVIYAFMEGVFDQQARIDAWLAAHPGTTDDNLWTLDEEDLDLANVASMATLFEDMRLAAIGVPALIVIDTQALALAGTDENDNGAMGKALKLLKVCSSKWQAPIVTVHHTGYDTSHARGASAWKAGCDLEIQVRSGELRATKVKGSRPTEWMSFELIESLDSVWAEPAVGSDGQPTRGASQEIIDLLRSEPRQLTKRQVIERLGATGRVKLAFTGLVETEEIISVQALREEGGRQVRREVWEVVDDWMSRAAEQLASSAVSS